MYSSLNLAICTYPRNILVVAVAGGRVVDTYGCAIGELVRVTSDGICSNGMNSATTAEARITLVISIAR